MTTVIRAIAHAIPSRVLTNEELEARFGARELGSITRMSGVKERRVVAPGQTAADLAFAAARRLLAAVDVDPASIGLLVFASQTPDYRIPATASVLQHRLGLSESCCTFDINQACASFLHALATAHGMIVSGVARRALVLNGDALSTLIHPGDRALVPLHGDAGAAALLEASDSGAGFEFFEFGTDGSKFDRLLVPAGGARLPRGPATSVETTDEAGCTRSPEHLYMDGPAVFHFCVYRVSDFVKAIFQARSLGVVDYDLFLFHQANKTMVDLVYRNVGVPPEKRFSYLEKVGNSSGASLPSLLSEAWRQGVVAPGSRTLLCGFGGGLAWGAASIRWPADAAAAVMGDIEVPASEIPGGAP